jgi:membrane-bound serine protease (ClpP class)
MAMVIILLLAGAVLLLLETILPGMIAGIAGLICLGAGLILGYQEFSAGTANLITLGVVLGLVVGTLAWLRYLPESRLGRVFVSERAIGDLGTERPELLHQTGNAFTNLRPSGTALINGKRVDVVTEGPHVERGTPIRVVAVEGLRVVVRAA